jgi:hypothetical protein
MAASEKAHAGFRLPVFWYFGTVNGDAGIRNGNAAHFARTGNAQGIAAEMPWATITLIPKSEGLPVLRGFSRSVKQDSEASGGVSGIAANSPVGLSRGNCRLMLNSIISH